MARGHVTLESEDMTPSHDFPPEFPCRFCGAQDFDGEGHAPDCDRDYWSRWNLATNCSGRFVPPAERR
jgi:hypothetical protein